MLCHPRLAIVHGWTGLVHVLVAGALGSGRPLRHLHVLHRLQLLLAQFLLLPLILHVLVQGHRVRLVDSFVWLLLRGLLEAWYVRVLVRYFDILLVSLLAKLLSARAAVRIAALRTHLPYLLRSHVLLINFR